DVLRTEHAGGNGTARRDDGKSRAALDRIVRSSMTDDNGGSAAAAAPADFIRAIVEDDIASHKHHGRVATRFPPEPNGYLHIGHAKSICLNFGVAQEHGGTCNLRFDDTNVLRAKIDMASPNFNMRDPTLYRIRHASHHRTDDRWRIYPMYDYAHPLSDALERITHSLCTLEYEDHRPLYDWLVNALIE